MVALRRFDTYKSLKTTKKGFIMSDALSHFDNKSLSYTYETNGFDFTNYFDGDLRITETEARGTLRETVAIEKVRDEVYVISWLDAEVGLIVQVVDFPNQRLLASLSLEGKVEIWPAKLTGFVEGKV